MAGADGLADWLDMELRARDRPAGRGPVNQAAHRDAGHAAPGQIASHSPIQRCIVNGRLLAGAMAWSAKAADLRRDPRYALHSTVTGPDSGEGELKLHGRAVQAGPGLRGQAAGAWWSAQPPGKAIVCVLRIGQALFVAWDLEHGEMTVHRWSPQAGYRQATRTYP